MAKRIVAVPLESEMGIKVYIVDIPWQHGINISQKRKNIFTLHKAAQKILGEQAKILEISTKSPESLGRSLSSFNLLIDLKRLLKTDRFFGLKNTKLPVELVFQGSKVFRGSEPYLIKFSNWDKKDWRKVKKVLPKGNALIAFDLLGDRWPLEPKSAFYDWLYLNALIQNPSVAEKLLEFDAFTDIEFNPEKAYNCQAVSAAIYVYLRKAGILTPKVETLTREDFLSLVESENLYSKVNFLNFEKEG